MNPVSPLDTTLLPPADLEFVVMTDTHHMLDPGAERIEFESRRRQSGRAGYALAKIASLNRAFVVHLGDLVQEFPEGPGFEASLRIALQAFRDAGVDVRQVAGNHDVGDKPDPTMPTEWATQETLDAFHNRFGSSWTSWNAGGCHFVILNSQIMNGPLPAVREQATWLEDDLSAHAGLPTFIFQHLSPFLVDPDEPGLGHYDNVDEPARSWLIDLIRRYDVRMVFSGHSHFGFFNRIGDARSYLVPSTAFTRPGFCEVFSSAPPPERGRDDAAKLGFLLVRLHDHQPRVHLVRTSGVTSAANEPPDIRQLVTAVTADLPTSPLGLTLRQQLAPQTEVPIAWQSTVRQPVRNDFPLLACLELGVRHIRVPSTDLANPLQRERLVALRDEGVTVTAFWIWSSRADIFSEATRHLDLLDGVEIQLPNELTPSCECLKVIRDLASTGVPVSLAPLLPHEHVPGKQHARTRIGYHLDELDGLALQLGEAGVRVDRVLCRLDGSQQPAPSMRPASLLSGCESIGTIDWAVEFHDGDRDLQIPRAIGTMAEVSSQPGSRLYLEPLIDMDRTMDAPPGFLDRLCNPHPVFHAARTLNTLLFRRGASWDTTDGPHLGGMATISLSQRDERMLLICQTSGNGERVAQATWPGEGFEVTHMVALDRGTIEDVEPGFTPPLPSGSSTALVARRIESA